MNKFSKFILAALLLVPSLSFAKVGTRNLEEDVKHTAICLNELDHTDTSSTTDVQGAGGIVFETSVASISAPTSTTGATTSPHTIVWPAKLQVQLLDAFPVATLTCTSVVLEGEDQFGTLVRETVSSITESEQTTATVFSKLNKVTGAGCANGGTGDVIQIKTSLEIGLGVKIARASDLESICIKDESVSGDPWGCAQLDNGTDDDIESGIDLSSHSVDLATTMFWSSSSTAAFSSGAPADSVCFRVRSSKSSGF